MKYYPPIGPLAWEVPYATSASLKSKKKKKKRIKVLSHPE